MTRERRDPNGAIPDDGLEPVESGGGSDPGEAFHRAGEADDGARVSDAGYDDRGPGVEDAFRSGS